jgi:prepilin-type N-terminal cleavage/methylation domain-containing protein
MNVYKYNEYIKSAFTLAEVLITLLIIGVVASLIIPNLINDAQNAEFKAAYKKAYGVATLALRKANAEGLIQEKTAWCDYPKSFYNWTAFKNQFSVVKECDYSNYQNNCWADGELIYQTNNPPGLPNDDISTAESFFVDSTGMTWVYFQCFYYLVDTNGLKGPNKYGRDRFEFTFTPSMADIRLSTGIPTLIGIFDDYPNVDLNRCPSGGCYYRSWLSQ